MFQKVTWISIARGVASPYLSTLKPDKTPERKGKVLENRVRDYAGGGLALYVLPSGDSLRDSQYVLSCSTVSVN